MAVHNMHVHVPRVCRVYVCVGVYVSPSQVVAVKGINPSGSCILVKQLWSHLPPPLPAAAAAHKQQTTRTAAAAGADAMDIDRTVADVAGEGLGSSGGLTAVVAAGPFCLADDLAYEPLQDLLQELKSKGPPNLLVRVAEREREEGRERGEGREGQGGGDLEVWGSVVQGALNNTPHTWGTLSLLRMNVCVCEGERACCHALMPCAYLPQTGYWATNTPDICLACCADVL